MQNVPDNQQRPSPWTQNGCLVSFGQKRC